MVLRIEYAVHVLHAEVRRSAEIRRGGWLSPKAESPKAESMGAGLCIRIQVFHDRSTIGPVKGGERGLTLLCLIVRVD